MAFAAVRASLLVAALLCGPTAAQGGGGVDLAIVRSAGELAAALKNGRAHIEIQEHLDLTAEPVAAGFEVSKPLYRVLSNTQSVRVRPGWASGISTAAPAARGH